MHVHHVARRRLSSILELVLAVTVSGCADEDAEVGRTEVIAGDVLDEIRDGYSTDEERCFAACEQIVADEGWYTVLECEAEACAAVDTRQGENTCEGTDDPPWDPNHEAVLVSCRLLDESEEDENDDSCSWLACGRRPQGHREAMMHATADGIGEWFAAAAHLERASVTAFAELAAWLDRHGAPPFLVERCRAAALDEVGHAALIAELAHRRGAIVPDCESESPAEDFLAVAIHNAVEGCVHESFAAIVAAHQALHARDDLGRSAFAEIAADELRHGELAWDLHVWLLEQLDDDARSVVARAQCDALATLPARVASTARVTPHGLGWPSPALVSSMAMRFAGLMAA